MKRGVIIGIGISFVILLGVILLLAGRGKSPTSSQQTLTIWSPFNEATIYNQISQKFLTANPNVKLNFQYIQADNNADYEAKVVNAIANGDGPDIWLERSDWIPKHVGISTPAQESGSYSAAIATVKQNIVPNLVNMNTINGKLYAMPLFADSLAVIYNSSLYNSLTANFKGAQENLAEVVPASWTDLISQDNLISQAKGANVNISGLALGTQSNTLDASDILSAFVAQGGTTSIISSDSKSVEFGLPQNVGGAQTFPDTGALSFYTSFASPGQPNYSWNESMGDPIQAFLQQKTAALVGYYSDLAAIVNQKPNFTIEVAPLVQREITDTSTRVDYGFTWSGAVNKNSSNTVLAWSYLASLTTPPVLQQYANLADHLDVSTNVESSGNLHPELINFSNAYTVYEDEFPTLAQLTSPDWQFRDQTLNQTINLVIDNSQQPQTAIDTAVQDFKNQFLGSP